MSLSRSASPDGPTPVPPWPPRPPRSSAPTPFPPATASAVAAPSPHPGSRPDLPPAPAPSRPPHPAPAPDAQTDPEPDRRRLAQDRPRRDAESSGAWYPGSPEHAAPVARLPTAEPEKTSPDITAGFDRNLPNPTVQARSRPSLRTIELYPSTRRAARRAPFLPAARRQSGA